MRPFELPVFYFLFSLQWRAVTALHFLARCSWLEAFDVPFGHVNRHAVAVLEIAIGWFSRDRQPGGSSQGIGLIVFSRLSVLCNSFDSLRWSAVEIVFVWS